MRLLPLLGEVKIHQSEISWKKSRNPIQNTDFEEVLEVSLLSVVLMHQRRVHSVADLDGVVDPFLPTYCKFGVGRRPLGSVKEGEGEGEMRMGRGRAIWMHWLKLILFWLSEIKMRIGKIECLGKGREGEGSESWRRIGGRGKGRKCASSYSCTLLRAKEIQGS